MPHQSATAGGSCSNGRAPLSMRGTHHWRSADPTRFTYNFKPPAYRATKVKETTPRGFEPLRAKPSGFLVHLLNHSDTVSVHSFRATRNALTTGICGREISDHPESNQGPFDHCNIYSRTLYQLSYSRSRSVRLDFYSELGIRWTLACEHRRDHSGSSRNPATTWCSNAFAKFSYTSHVLDHVTKSIGVYCQ
jgi:hypothetical protein